MTDRLDLPDRYRVELEALLRKYVPDVEVWAYGSRVHGESHEASDLDLVLRGPNLQPLGADYLDLIEALEKSNIPILVQAHDWTRLPASFHRQIEREFLVIQEPEEERRRARASWQEVVLGDLCEIKHGFAFKGVSIHEDPLGDVLLTPGNFAIGGGFKAGKFKYFDGPVPEGFVLSKGDLIITMTDLSKQSDTLGYPALVPECPNGRRYLHNQRLGKVIFKEPREVDKRYIYYVLCSDEYRNEVLAGATGTTVKHTSPDRVKQFRFILPPLPEQRTIAHVLGTLDDKVELNRRMNEALEAMARALFKSWFVDFHPVRAKMEGRWCRGETLPGLPAEHYDQFPDRLVDSEIGEIPQGWEVKPLGEVVELAYGKALRAVDRKDGPVPVYGSNGQVGWHDKELVAGPGIIVGRKGNPGVVTWAHGDFFPIDTTFFVVPRDANEGLPFLFFALIGQDLPSVSADSAVPGLNRNLAYMNKQLMPDKHVLAEFNDYIDAIFTGCLRLAEESRVLAAQRDALLPGLVSGNNRVGKGSAPLTALPR